MSFLRAVAALALLPLLTGCPGTESITPPEETDRTHDATFVGFFYDGATGARIGSYGMGLTVADLDIPGVVGDDGRFVVGPIGVWDDFTVVANLDGYRAFRSHNQQVGLPDALAQSDDIADISTHQTLHFDAYVFPDTLQSPASNLTIVTSNGDAPSGTIRLRPITRSVLDDSITETPSGIPDQLWLNDEDLQSESVSKAFSDGALALAAGELVYGVRYLVNIYDVPGYQPLESTFTSGIDAEKTFTLVAGQAEPLAVLSNTVGTCTPPIATATGGAEITIVFNHSIEFVDTGYPGGPLEAIDDSFAIVSPNADLDMITNTLNPDTTSGAQERGASLTIAGDTLTFSWNPSSGLAIADADDPIQTVTYGNLGSVTIQRIGVPASQRALSNLVGNSLVCSL